MHEGSVKQDETFLHEDIFARRVTFNEDTFAQRVIFAREQKDK